MRVDLEQREIALAFLRAADVAVDGVAGAQAEAADLRGRDVDVVGAGQVVRFRRAQEAEAVRQHFDDAFADDVGLARRELLEDAEHQLLLAHGRGVLDLELFGKGDELGRSLGLEVLEFHFPHTNVLWKLASGGVESKASLARRRGKARRSLGSEGFGAPDPMHRPAPIHWSQNSTASAYVRWDAPKIRKDGTSGKGRESDCALGNASTRQNGFTTTRITMTIIRTVGTSLIIR